MEVKQVSSVFVTSEKTLGHPEKEPEIFASEPGLSNKEHILVTFLGNRKSSLELRQMETTQILKQCFPTGLPYLLIIQAFLNLALGFLRMRAKGHPWGFDR